MFLFLFIFLLVYGGLNAYVLVKVQAVFRCGIWSTLLIAAFLFLMLLLPLSLRMLARPALFEVARVVAFAGYLWMVIVLWFFFFGIIIDLANLAGHTVGVAGIRPGFRIVPGLAFGINVFAICVMLGLAARENRILRLETVPIFAPRMPPGIGELRIVQVSDLHYSMYGGQECLKLLVDQLHALKPDVVVVTGDLLDVMGDLAQPLERALSGIRPPYGKFAVLGNHEFYMGAEASVAHLHRSGFKVLREEYVVLDIGGWPLRIAGVDDPAGRHTGQTPLLEEATVLSDDQEREFTVLLKHQPHVEPDSRGRFDLQLSGHTHGGQIFPFHIVVYFSNRYFRGLYPIKEGGQIYVSRGAGSWGPPLRLLAPREITLFVIRGG